MVICKYFQNGNCRFGSKCVNDHLDMKQIIKGEVEAAVKGFQWPLSCFGPFKEKPSIPNFIEDQSFEEIRHLCYEARKQNCFPQFQQQFNQQILQAQTKMNQLLSLSSDVVNIVTQIYESGVEVNKAMSAPVNNPFSNMGNNQTSTSNLFGNNQMQSNPFAKSVSTGFVGAAVTPNNIFGSSIPPVNQTNRESSNSNIFANNSSIFGGSMQQTQPQPTPFAGAFTSQPIFGGQTQQQPGSIFGGSSNQQNLHQNQSISNVFGSTNTSNNPGIFGSNQPSTQSNIFQQTNSTNIFEQMQSTQQPSFAPQNQEQNTGFATNQNKSFTFSSFLQSPNQPQNQAFGQQVTSQGIFSNSTLNANQNQNPSQNATQIQNYSQNQSQNLNYNQNQPQNPNQIYNHQNQNQNPNPNQYQNPNQSQNQGPNQNQNQNQSHIQNQSHNQNQNQNQGNIQNLNQNHTQTQQNQSIFAQAVQQHQQNIPQQNVPQQNSFVQTNQNQAVPSQPPIFGNQQAQTSTQNVTTNLYPMDYSSQNIFAQAAASIMQETSKSNNQFDPVGQKSQVNQNNYSLPGVYSKLEFLTAEALEAFKAHDFLVGKVPTVPPPKELCF